MAKKMVLILVVTGILAGLLLYVDRSKMVQSVERNEQGGGVKTEQFRVFVDGKELEGPLEVEIEEERYTDEELERAFQTVMNELDEIVLGENESFDRVETDLNFVSKVGDFPIQIQWQLDSYHIIGADGCIRGVKVDESGVIVGICGILSYEDHEAMYVRHARVYPQTKTKEDTLMQEVKDAYESREEAKKEEEEVPLPTRVNGKEIKWKTLPDDRGYVVALLGMVMACILPLWKRQKEKEKEKKKQEELRMDYPKIITAFSLFLETGMTVKHIWEKMVLQYEEESRMSGERAVYHQMRETYYEMKRGVVEAEAYEKFGQRCELVEYRKFASILSQNVRKGTKGIAQLLYMEAIQATENQKSYIKRKAEEAGTKLLVPMFVMLCIVLVIIIVPAFLSMNL